MKCPKCQTDVEAHPVPHMKATAPNGEPQQQMRAECPSCGHRWFWWEQTGLDDILNVFRGWTSRA